MNPAPIPDDELQDAPVASGRGAPPESASSRRLFLLLAGTTALAFVLFRTDALLRVQGPLIADSTEYLLLVNSLLTGADVPVQPVRNCFFALLVSGLYAPLNAVLEQPFHPAVGRVLPLLFHAGAVLGSWALAREILGSRVAATVAALLLAVLPDYGYWSSDLLTDVPASACVVWGVVLWLRGKPLGSGLLFGIGVLLRYQALTVLLPFLVVVAFTRRRRQLVRSFAALLIVPAGLALLDGLYWGEPWLSVREHFSVFGDHLGRSLGSTGASAVPDAGADPGGLLRAVWAPFRKAGHSDFLWEAPRVLGWLVIAAVLSWPLARRRIERPSAGDATVAVCALTFLGLCFLADDDTRYLVAITPLLAAVGGCCAWVWIEALANRWPFRSPAAPGRLPVAGLIAVVAWICGSSWIAQSRLPYRPFGAVLDAVTDLSPAPGSAEGTAVRLGLFEHWVVAHERPLTGQEWCSWNTRRLRLTDLACVETAVGAFAPGGDEYRRATRTVAELEFLVLTRHGPAREAAPELWGLLNRRAVLDAVFHDPAENVAPAWRFRLLPDGAGEEPFWSAGEVADSDVVPLATFAGGTSLVRIEAIAYPSHPGAVRLDFTWRFDEAPSAPLRCRVQLRNENGEDRTVDRHRFVPPGWIGGGGRFTPGATGRVSRHLVFPPGELDEGLRLLVEVYRRKEAPSWADYELQGILWSRESVESTSTLEEHVVPRAAASAESG